MGYIHVTTTILKRLWNCVNCKYAHVYLCIASPLVLKKVSKCLGTEETGCWIDGRGTQMLLMHTFYLNGDNNLDQHRLVLTLHLKTLRSVSNNQIRNGPETPHRSCYIPTFHYSTQPPCVRVADYQIIRFDQKSHRISHRFSNIIYIWVFKKLQLWNGAAICGILLDTLCYGYEGKERCTLLADAAAKHLCEKISRDTVSFTSWNIMLWNTSQSRVIFTYLSTLVLKV